MSDRRHEKLGILRLISDGRDEMPHWRAPKHTMFKQTGTDRRSGPAQKRRNFWPLAALLANALLWVGIYWGVAALFLK